MQLRLLDGLYTICRLDAGEPVPAWALNSTGLVSITRTPAELSVLCLERDAGEVRREDGWRILEVAGPLDFALTGILASVAAPLAASGISLFALSTFDTDYVLVKEIALRGAIGALEAAGHTVR